MRFEWNDGAEPPLISVSHTRAPGLWTHNRVYVGWRRGKRSVTFDYPNLRGPAAYALSVVEPFVRALSPRLPGSEGKIIGKRGPVFLDELEKLVRELEER